MNKFCYGLVMLAFVAACTEPKEEPLLLGEEKIARIMADLSIAEAGTTGLSGSVKDSLYLIYYKQVFEIHQATQDQYEKDLQTLGKDIIRLQKVVTNASKLLEKPELKPNE